MLSTKDYIVAKVLLCWILIAIDTPISQMRELRYRLIEITAQVSESVKYLLNFHVTIFVYKSCHSKRHILGGLNLQKCILPEFWRPQV